MKRTLLSVLALLGMGTMATAQFFVVKEGAVIFALPEGTPDYVVFEDILPCGGIVGEPVDMGLSVKWSSVNIGASSPEQYGNYYAWGERVTKENYSWSTYKHMQSGKSDWYGCNKYQVDDHRYEGVWYKDAKYYNNGGKTVLDKVYDAAAFNWKGDWAMPTQAEWNELYNNTTRTWASDYNGSGVSGYILTSKVEGYTEASIFLPAAGYRHGSDLHGEGSDGSYWSSSLGESDSDDGRSVYFNSGNFSTNGSYDRYYGQSVRPVCPAQGITNGHDAVDLGLPSGKLWASRNVGASAPEESGDYFAWGETAAKSDYSWATYTGDPAQFKGDNKTTLDASDDVATQSWGEEWRMPTFAQWQELYNGTTHTWTDDYNGTGVKGYILTSKVEGHTEASIFLPAAGYRNGSGLYNEGSNGYYWSSKLIWDDSGNVRCVSFYSGLFDTFGYNYRCYGQPVRPVCPAQK